jgi:trimeric autotransporter adhesin
MKSSIAVLIAALAVFTMGCGNYNSSNMMSGGPNVMQLAPNSIAAGSQQLLLTVDGNGFANNSVVYWAGMAQPTTFVTASQLRATIPASQIAFPEMVQVYVRSNNLNSNAINFTVN